MITTVRSNRVFLKLIPLSETISVNSLFIFRIKSYKFKSASVLLSRSEFLLVSYVTSQLLETCLI